MYWLCSKILLPIPLTPCYNDVLCIRLVTCCRAAAHDVKCILLPPAYLSRADTGRIYTAAVWTEGQSVSSAHL